jgi:hypothetical protein
MLFAEDGLLIYIHYVTIVTPQFAVKEIGVEAEAVCGS